jgi:hypothetical protein
MTEDLENLERLASERGDGPISAREAAEWENAIARHPGLAAEARAYERLARLLADWRPLPGGIAWADTARRISRHVAGQVEHRVVDEAVDALAGPLPDVDWDALKNRISAAVRGEAGHVHAAPLRLAPTPAQRHRWTWAVRAGLLTAAAAAVALLLSWPQGAAPPVPGQADRPNISVALEAPHSSGKVSIVFDEAPPRPGKGPADPAAPPSAGIAQGPPEKDAAEPAELALY